MARTAYTKRPCGVPAKAVTGQRKTRKAKVLPSGEDCVGFCLNKLRSGEIKVSSEPKDVFASYGALFGYTSGTFRNKLNEAKAKFTGNGNGGAECNSKLLWLRHLFLHYFSYYSLLAT